MRRFLVFSGLWIPVLALVVGAEDDLVNAYRFRARHLTVVDRIALATNTIKTSQDEDVVLEAVKDIGRFALSSENPLNVKDVVNYVLTKTTPDSLLFREAQLTKAAILAREGHLEKAIAIYRHSITQLWDETLCDRYQMFLWKMGEDALLAVDDYERQVTKKYPPDVKAFYGLGRDFAEMFCRLRAMRIADPDSSAMRDVFPHLKESEDRPYAKEIANALCIAADGDYNTGLKLLKKIDTLCASESVARSRYDESQDLPLYRATLLFFEGRDFNDARASLRQYVNRNKDVPARVLVRTLKMCYGMENCPEDLQKLVELTDFLINSQLLEEPVASQLPRDQVASLLDMHHTALWWQNRLRDGQRVALDVMGEYYPDTLAGANAAMNFGLSCIYLDKDRESAVRIWRDILEKAPYDDIVPLVKACLAGSAFHREEYERADALRRDVLDRLDPSPQGAYLRCKDAMLHLGRQIERRGGSAAP